MTDLEILDRADPGIRARLATILAAGLKTSDSGDGASKPAEERAMDVPHVAVRCAADDLVATADRLLSVVPDAHVEPGLFRDGAGWGGLIMVWWGS